MRAIVHFARAPYMRSVLPAILRELETRELETREVETREVEPLG